MSADKTGEIPVPNPPQGEPTPTNAAQTTMLAGVCGWPIHHSLSPFLHNFWLKELGLKGAYVHFAVRPDEAVHAFQTLKRTSISGVNVTLPLKRLAFEAADSRTPDAQKLGVANCLYKREGKLIAHNTDMQGFAAPLLKKVNARELLNAPTFLIGSGGASRAVIGALLAMGIPEIRVCGRTDSKVEDICAQINVPSPYPVKWADRLTALSGAKLIINATAGGMEGKPALDISLARATPGALIYDLIYTPQITPLLSEAKYRGHDILGGLDMLVEQARPSFKLFYGIEPPAGLDPRPLLTKILASRP